ncbi:MAG: glutamate racemase [Comamonadaceae bacterium]|nr:MAG: glutamate racemase [Comamonadaceae bacterium]
MQTTWQRPIGVFDSGIGGLSILQALRRRLPSERFVYYADLRFAPYGERGEDYVVERSRAIARELLERHAVKAVVVACNTATAAAIRGLREEQGELPLVGVEPALKPAAATSRTRRIAVLATRGTLQSDKFKALHATLATQAEFRMIACDGLAAAIESGDTSDIERLCARYLGEAGEFGRADGQLDTLVFGCTHYPLVAQQFRDVVGPGVTFIDTGLPVAIQTERLLAASQLLAPAAAPGRVVWTGSGDLGHLRAAVQRWFSPDAEQGASIADSGRTAG